MFNLRSSVICSIHFTHDDYKLDVKAELFNLPPKRVLKTNAVPSVKICSRQIHLDDQTINLSREDRLCHFIGTTYTEEKVNILLNEFLSYCYSKLILPCYKSIGYGTYKNLI